MTDLGFKLRTLKSFNTATHYFHSESLTRVTMRPGKPLLWAPSFKSSRQRKASSLSAARGWLQSSLPGHSGKQEQAAQMCRSFPPIRDGQGTITSARSNCFVSSKLKHLSNPGGHFQDSGYRNIQKKSLYDKYPDQL